MALAVENRRIEIMRRILYTKPHQCLLLRLQVKVILDLILDVFVNVNLDLVMMCYLKDLQNLPLT